MLSVVSWNTSPRRVSVQRSACGIVTLIARALTSRSLLMDGCSHANRRRQPPPPPRERLSGRRRTRSPTAARTAVIGTGRRARPPTKVGRLLVFCCQFSGLALDDGFLGSLTFPRKSGPRTPRPSLPHL